MKDLPYSDRPRERLLASGAGGLSNAELLAILLRTGTHENSALHVAEQLLADCQGHGLASLLHQGVEGMARVKGVGMAKAATLLAALELGLRLSKEAAKERVRIRGPKDAALHLMPFLRFEPREKFALLLLNTKGHVLSVSIVAEGGLSSAYVEPRAVFGEAMRHSAASVILAHNHPSGDPAPSKEDIRLTERLIKAGKLLDIPVHDHIIIGDNKFISLKEEGMIE